MFYFNTNPRSEHTMPSVHDFYMQTARQKGSGASTVYRGSPFLRGGQSGDGFGSILSSIARTVLPVVKKIAPLAKRALPLAKTVGKQVAKTGATALGSYASDLIDGVSPKKAAQKRSSDLFEEIKKEGKKRLADTFNDSRKKPPSKKRRSTPLANKRKRKRRTRSDLYGKYR